MKRIQVMVLAAAALAFSLSPAHARTARQYYVGGSDAVAGFCDPEARGEDNRNIGYVCFSLDTSGGGADRGKRLDLTIEDDVLNPVPFFWIFEDANGDCVGASEDPTAACPNAAGGCGEVTNLAIPNGAVEIVVALEGPVLGALDCLVFGGGEEQGHATLGSALMNVHSL
ncbi:MAG TPA: hypothetical protein VGB83_02955 [Actinomycetota bacterium]